jgi:hypothetical protein
MRLGPANLGRKARPLGARARQAQAGRDDQPYRIAHLVAQAARRHPQHMSEKPRENPGITAAVGVGEGRARRSGAARMIKPRLMARHRGFDVAQRMRPRQLTKQQRQQLPLGRETAHQLVGPVLLHKPLKGRPGQQLQNVAENRIRMRHGADPFSCPSESPNSGND